MSVTTCFSLGEQACLSSGFLTQAASLVDWPKLLPFSSKPKVNMSIGSTGGTGSARPPIFRGLNEDSIYFSRI